MPEVDLEPQVIKAPEPFRLAPSLTLPRRLKVAMVGQKGLPATYGGVEHHVENLSKGLAGLGHEVTVFCRPYYSPDLQGNFKGSTSATFAYNGIELKLVKSWQTKHLDAISHSALSALISSLGDYDIIHFHGIGPSLASFLPGLFGKKVVATVHAFDFHQRKWGRFAKWCLKMGLRCALTFPQKTICVSKTIQANLGAGENLVYIPNGVKDPHRWGVDELDWIRSQGLEPGKYILFVGRLIEDKGCHLLCQAVREIGGGLSLAVAGDSSFSDDYVKRLKQTAGTETIFLGNVYNEKLSALYSNCAIFVLPSSVEGLPIVLIEAMKHGAPALVSDIPENMEILNGSGNFGPVGICFKNGDVQNLKDTIMANINSADFLRRLERNAREYVERKFNWQSIVAKTERVYFEVLGL